MNRLYVVLERRKGWKTWRLQTLPGNEYARGFTNKADAIRDAKWDTAPGYEWAVCMVGEVIAQGEVPEGGERQ